MDGLNTPEESLARANFNDKIYFANNKKQTGSQYGRRLTRRQNSAPVPLDVDQNINGVHHNVLWDFSLEDIDYKENVLWLSNPNATLTFELSTSIVKGAPIENIENETTFCAPSLLKDILRAKNIFDELNEAELYHARARANPFETICSAIFMNRAALKMANIDRATDFMFSAIDNNPCHKKEQGAYYFADICGGPGGFSEYILWRRHWLFKGFGFTLRGKTNFKLENSKCSSDVTFNAHFGARDDGNIFYPENIHSFAEVVARETDGLGVHFVMSDGGFSVEGEEHLQEVLSKQLYACQCYMALQVLRPHGHFVTKVFDLFTSFSVGLVFLMYKCFEKVTILKPNTSRPANSERYLVCYGLKTDPLVEKVNKHLLNIITILEDNRTNKNTALDILEIVPMSIIMQDKDFYSYLVESNNRIGRNQIVALQKLAAFCRNPYLVETRQDVMRTSCLEYWQIPTSQTQSLFSIFTTDNLYTLLTERDCLQSTAAIINSNNGLLTHFFKTNHLHYIPSGNTSNGCSIFAAVNRYTVYRLNITWVKQKKIRLFCGSILFGEIVTEYIVSKSDPSIVKERKCLHIIDALRLGSCDVSNLPFTERQSLIFTYCDAVNHESRDCVIRIRQKPVNIIKTLLINPMMMYDESEMVYRCALETLGVNSVSEYYCVKSILFCETGYGVSFDEMFKSRVVILLREENSSDEPCISEVTLNCLTNYVRDVLLM